MLEHDDIWDLNYRESNVSEDNESITDDESGDEFADYGEEEFKKPLKIQKIIDIDCKIDGLSQVSSEEEKKPIEDKLQGDESNYEDFSWFKSKQEKRE